MERPRLLPRRCFPAYAYLPGQHPHPVRHPGGHSYRVEPVRAVASLASDEFVWGEDLFNNGYYWEAHEAWEGLWQTADKNSSLRGLLKGLILLSACGVKIREGKSAAAMGHARRGGKLLRELARGPQDAFSRALGMSSAQLADLAEATADAPPTLHVTEKGRPEPVFDFLLGYP